MLLTMTAIDITVAILFIILAYLIGSIPFGIVIGKGLCGKDIRLYGSKNIGSTNAIRVLGKKIGFLVFFCDVFKGMAVILLVMLLGSLQVWSSEVPYIIYGIAAILGHVFPIYLNFKGGKAVATSLGVVLVICPLAAILCLICFYLVLKITGYVSLASTGATITVVTTAWILYGVGLAQASNFLEVFITNPTLLPCILFSLVGVLIIVKHFKNYKRLLNGTENSFKKKKA